MDDDFGFYELSFLELDLNQSNSMAENFPQHEPDEEPQVLSFDGLSQAFAKALSRGGKSSAGEAAEVAETEDIESDVDGDDGESDSQEVTCDSGVTDESGTFNEFGELVEESGDWDVSLDEVDTQVSPHSILEAMLFVDNSENQPLEPARAAVLMRGVEPEEIESIVCDLNREYHANNCPYEIVATGGGFRLVLREAYYSVRDKFYGRVREARLSQAAVDTLALVAYRQPITADEVNKLRDKPSGHLLTQLVRRRLLRVERTDTKPRKTLYRTTDRFLELFGLESPSDLPQIDEMDD